MDNLIAALAKEPTKYDTTRFFVHGCSMGSAFTVWQGPCLHSKAPASVSAFATHSTGLKVKVGERVSQWVMSECLPAWVGE
jgi:hypothetical protein